MPKPTYEEIASPNRSAGLRAFLRGLKPGVPKPAPVDDRHIVSSEMTRMGHELQCSFRSKTIDGVIYVTRVRAEG